MVFIEPVTLLANILGIHFPRRSLEEIFNDAFTMCIFTAIVLTEWYQAADLDELLEYRAKDTTG